MGGARVVGEAAAPLGYLWYPPDTRLRPNEHAPRPQEHSATRPMTRARRSTSALARARATANKGDAGSLPPSPVSNLPLDGADMLVSSSVSGGSSPAELSEEDYALPHAASATANLNTTTKATAAPPADMLVPAIKTDDTAHGVPRALLKPSRSCRDLDVDTSNNTCVITVGCYDMFHRGHLKLFNTLMSAGNKLVVGVHDDRSIFLNKGIRTGDPTITRVCNVRRVLRPQDEIFIVVDRDPTACLREVVPRLRHEGFDGAGEPFGSIVYMRGDDMPNFPGRAYLEEEGVEVVFLPYTQGVSATKLRRAWGCSMKMFDDRLAMNLLEAHEVRVYKPIRKALERSVTAASATPAGKAALRSVSPNRVTIASCLCTLPYVALVLHGSPASLVLAALLALVHDGLDRLDGAVAGAYRTLGLKHDGDFGAYLDAMCDKVFGILALLVWARVLYPSGDRPEVAVTLALTAAKLPLHIALGVVRTVDYRQFRAASKGPAPKVALPAVGEGKLATCSENVGMALLPLAFAARRAGLAVVSAGVWCAVVLLLTCSVDMAMRSLRHKLRARW